MSSGYSHDLHHGKGGNRPIILDNQDQFMVYPKSFYKTSITAMLK